MSYRYLQSVDRMREEIEETWEVRDLIDAIKTATNKGKLRYNLDLIIHELATHICHDRRRDLQEARAECSSQA